MRGSPIILKPGWSAAPRGIVGTIDTKGHGKPGLLSQFTIGEARLFFVLADLCKHAGEYRATNAELMKATGLDDRYFRRARAGLEHVFNVISSKPTDTRKEQYIYTVVKSAQAPKITGESNDGADLENVKAVPIPDEILHSALTGVPDLGSRRGR